MKIRKKQKMGMCRRVRSRQHHYIWSQHCFSPLFHRPKKILYVQQNEIQRWKITTFKTLHLVFIARNDK